MTALHPQQDRTYSGLPTWVCSTLDGACGSGAIRWHDLDGLDTDQLMHLAREIVARQLDPIDVGQLVEQVRQ